MANTPSPVSANKELHGDSVRQSITMDDFCEELGHAANMEWPTQPFSSLEQMNLDADMIASRIDPALQTEALSDPPPAEGLTQRGPLKIPLLARPQSSHEDPAAGFSFAKAMPMKPLDFSRKLGSNVTNSSTHQLPPTTSEPPRPDPPAVSPPVQSVDGNAGDPQSGFATRAPSVQDAAGDRSNASPLSNMAVCDLRQEAQAVSADQTGHHTPSPPTVSKASLDATDNTLVGTETDDLSHQHTHDEFSNSHEKPASNYGPSTFVRFEDAAFPSSKHQHSGAGVHAAQCGVSSKTRQPRRKKQNPTRFRAGHTASATTSADSASSEQLLQLLTYKERQNAEERRVLEEEQRGKDAELQRLVNLINSLYSELQEITQRHDDQAAQMSKINKAKAGWSNKIKKIVDYVKGLTNDHNRLRDDARDIRVRQGEMLDEKTAIVDALRQVHEVAGNHHAQSKESLNQARHDLHTLEQAMQHQQARLEQDKSLLLLERERNDRLEAQITTFTNSQAHLLELFVKNRDVMVGKFEDLLCQSKQAQSASIETSPSQERLESMIQRCANMIKDLPRADHSATAEDLNKFSQCMLEQLDRVTHSVEIIKGDITLHESGHQQSTSSIQTQLTALYDNVLTEKTLSEQIIDLREMKVTVRERLQATENSLRDTRLENFGLRQKDLEQARRIAALEQACFNSKNRQASPDPQTMLRLHEIDSLNKDLVQKLATQDTEAKALLEQIQGKGADICRLQEENGLVKRHLEEAQQRASVAEKAHVDAEKRAAAELEQLRKQMSEATEKQVSALRKDHNNEIMHLKSEKSPDADKANDLAIQLNVAKIDHQKISLQDKKSKAENIALQKEIANLKTALTNSEAAKSREASRADNLSHQIAQYAERNMYLENDKESTQQLDHDIQNEQEGIIQALRKSIKHLQNELKAKEGRDHTTTHASAGPYTENHPLPAVVEDSQPRFADMLGMTNDSEEEQYETPDENLFDGLFPEGTPKAPQQDIETSEFSMSMRKTTSRGRVESPSVRQTGLSHQRETIFAHSPHLFQTARPSPNRGDPSAHRPSHGFSRSQTTTGASPAPASRMPGGGAVTQPMGYKPTTFDPRGEKRSITKLDASVAASGSQANKRRQPSIIAPMIADSQSPGSSQRPLTGRAQKQVPKSRRNAQENSKYNKKWDQHIKK